MPEPLVAPEPTKPILIFAYGNPSRGDDALGPALLQRLAEKIEHSDLHTGVELLTDFQLQIEHALDMENRRQVIFVDASITPEKAFSFSLLEGEKDDSYSSHAMSPEALLNLFQQLHPDDSTEVFLLAIRGYRFDLGQPLTGQAEINLEQAVDYIYQRLLSTA
ncbi:[NiFe] hydrogenase HoxFUYH(E) maturation factor HoxW [hydrothermal vent metagenome]|uniref:[NiFe] hydrogenase HoxFUYH(E) maturation factor HoxW n=1 Tax=hydrothermal vent metagenome TaxID=652676 RepID=A0A3B1B3Y7_9ZZZZ